VQRPLPLHGALPEPLQRPRFAIAAKGFRPFFLLAAVHAVVIIPIWLTIVTGSLAPTRYLDAASWHAHEMLFGYATAVIAGFLLTAVGNWTQRETLTGRPLLALAGLWVLGRVAMAAAPALPRGSTALVDLAFLPVLAGVLARPLLATGNRRNFVMLGVVTALFGCNLVVHLEALSVLPPGSARRACSSALDVIVLLMLVITGRVVPMFTRNATRVEAIASMPRLDRATVIAAAGMVLVDVVWPDSSAAAAAAGSVGMLATVRAARWGSLHTARTPLLWILHLGYAWLIVGLGLRALPLGGLAAWGSLATHALTVGAIGGLTLGMMARVALGHTGRTLAAPPAMAWAFAAITLAAAVRALVPLVAPGGYSVSLLVAGALWTLAFLVFLCVYAPILTAPRFDGKAG
jgi:uncharacterized protein involved in response to NO